MIPPPLGARQPIPRTVVDVHYQGVWHSVRVLYFCDKGIATDLVQRTYMTDTEPHVFSPLYNEYQRHMGERQLVIEWQHVWALRPRARCPECHGAGETYDDTYERNRTGTCPICDGSGRYIPAPWADATTGLGLGAATTPASPHIGFKEH